MNPRRTTPILIAAFAALSQPAFAQGVPLLPAEQGRAKAPSATAGQGVAIARASGPAWLEKKIDLDIRNASVLDAVKGVLAAAGAGKANVDTEIEIPSEMRLTLAVKGVRARDALAAVARLGGAVAYVSQTDDLAAVQLRPRTENAPMVIPMTPNPLILSDNPLANLFQGDRRALSGKSVSVDKRDAEVREILKDVLTRADVAFIFDEIPENVKRSFVFENVPLPSALDLICQSADLAWSVTGTGDRTVVRIFKPTPRRPSRSGRTTTPGATR